MLQHTLSQPVQRLIRLAALPGWLLKLSLILALLLAAPTMTAFAATITVGGSGDTGCSLAQAVQAANTDAVVGGCTAGSGADTIVLDVTSTVTYIPDATLDITTTITITGNSNTISGNNARRIFYVPSGGNLTLNTVTLTGGQALQGGAIRVINGGAATINNSVISGNSASSPGGDIATGGGIQVYDSGTLTITSSVIRNNSAANFGA